MPVSLQYMLSSLRASEVRETLITLFAHARFPVSSWQPYSAGRTLVEGEAWTLADLTTLVSRVARGGFLDYAEGRWLDLLAENLYALERKRGVPTRGTLRLTDAGDVGPVNISPGALRVLCGDAYYTNIDGGTLTQGGLLELTFQAEQLGTVYNVPDGSIFELVTTIPGVTVATVAAPGSTWISRQGIDDETDEALRVRCRTKWPTLGGGATAAAYQHWAMSASAEVAKVAVFPHQPQLGSVTVVLAGAAGPVSPDAVTTVKLALSDDRVPVCVNPVVKSATPRTLTIRGDVLVKPARISPAKASIRKALIRLVADLPLGGTLYSGQVIRAIMTADPGVIDVTLATGDADVTLGAAEVGVLGLVFSTSAATGLWVH